MPRLYGPRSEQDCSLGGRASQNGATLELPLKANYWNDVPFVACERPEMSRLFSYRGHGL